MSPIDAQKQQELFEEFVIKERRRGRFLGALRFKKPLFPQHRLNISVSYEVLIIGLIGLVLTISIVFSLGVERGRNLKFAEYQTQFPEKPAEVQKQPEVKPGEEKIEKVIPVPPEKKPFTIQVASFRTRTLAEKELSRLKNIGYSSDVLRKGEYFIVCVGAYAKKELAQRTLRDLRRIYKDCYVRRR